MLMALTDKMYPDNSNLENPLKIYKRYFDCNTLIGIFSVASPPPPCIRPCLYLGIFPALFPRSARRNSSSGGSSSYTFNTLATLRLAGSTGQ